MASMILTELDALKRDVQMIADRVKTDAPKDHTIVRLAQIESRIEWIVKLVAVEG